MRSRSRPRKRAHPQQSAHGLQVTTTGARQRRPWPMAVHAEALFQQQRRAFQPFYRRHYRHPSCSPPPALRRQQRTWVMMTGSLRAVSPAGQGRHPSCEAQQLQRWYQRQTQQPVASTRHGAATHRYRQVAMRWDPREALQQLGRRRHPQAARHACPSWQLWVLCCKRLTEIQRQLPLRRRFHGRPLARTKRPLARAHPWAAMQQPPRRAKAVRTWMPVWQRRAVQDAQSLPFAELVGQRRNRLAASSRRCQRIPTCGHQEGRRGLHAHLGWMRPSPC